MEVSKFTRHRGGLHDRRPCIAQGIVEHRTAGFFIQHARDVALRNCRVLWGEDPPDYFGHALEALNVEGLKLVDFQGGAAHPERDKPTLVDG